MARFAGFATLFVSLLTNSLLIKIGLTYNFIRTHTLILAFGGIAALKGEKE